MKKSYILLFMLIFLFSAQKMKAQDFEVSPVKIQFLAEPGEAQTIPVTVTNHSSVKTSFTVGIKDFTINQNGERESHNANSTPNSCASLLSISPQFFDLQPNESKEFAVSIQVPMNDYSTKWCMVFVRNAEEQTALNADRNLRAGVTVGGQIGIVVTQSPPSNQNYKATIYNLIQKAKLPNGDITYSATIENQGEKIIDAKIYLVASNLATGEEIQYNPIESTVYPGMKRDVTLTLPAGLPSGQYALAAILDYGSYSTLEGTQIIIQIP